MQNYTLTYTYDQLGNILEQKNIGNWTRKYEYSTNNYLLSTQIGSGTGNYTNDAHGNMIKMPHLPEMLWDYDDNLKEADINSDNRAYYTYDVEGNRVRKVVVKGNTTEEKIYIGDYEIYRKSVGNLLKSERKTVHISDDKSGRSETEVSQKRYKYVMKELDNETRLYYYGARYYATWIGRWTAVDPMAKEYLAWSPYNFCADNPVNYIDEKGEKWKDPK